MSTPAPDLLARSHRLSTSSHQRSIRGDVARLSTRFKSVFKALALAAKSEKQMARGAEWLLDNDYIIQRALRLVRRSLPNHYVRELPVLEEGGQIRVRELSEFALQSGGIPLDTDWLKQTLRTYQQVNALRIGELWALPAMLRLSVLVRLSAAAENLHAHDDVDSAEHAGQRANEIASLVVSLRTLEAHNWLAFVEDVSTMESALREDPSGHYALMEKSTRNQYRQQVEQLARWARGDETDIAQQAVGLAERATSPGREQHVGYYLIDRGRKELEHKTRARVPWHRRVARAVRHAAPWLYPTAISTTSAAVSLLAWFYLHAAGVAPWLGAVTTLVLFVPVSSVVTALTNWCITQFTAPRILPKLDFDKSVTLDCRAAVAVPVILSQPTDIAPILARLEMNYLGNSEPNLHYVLLTDDSDAHTRTTEADAAVHDAIHQGVVALRERHPEGRFFWLHRPRRFNEIAGKWMGWERKRGKLVDFNQLLLHGDSSAFSLRAGEIDRLTGLRYVITLDADTQLPTGAAQRLLGTFSHPLNRAQFDAQSGRVCAGYTIIQPRVDTSPQSANRSAFARSYSGDTLLDLYSTAVSDVYNDAIGSAIFAGKAVYDVGALERSLDNRVPDNSVLSHDLFEGLHGRVGLASEILVFENFPAGIPAFMRRMHRWVRGDWQLLPWLFSRVPCADGTRQRTRLRMIDRWKIGDNLRRALDAPALVLLLALSWLVLPVPAWIGTLVVLATLATPLLLGLAGGLLGMVNPRSNARRVIATTGWNLRQEARRVALRLLLLPYEATTSVDAILRTLWRLRFGHDKLLEWMPAAFADRKLGAALSFGAVLRESRDALFLILIIIVLLLMFAPLEHVWTAVPMLLVWLMLPFAIIPLSRVTPSVAPQILIDKEARTLRLLARKTWSFFEKFAGPDHHWLPPDNYHEEPRAFVAERTSPTNIGLMLTSTLAAYDFGYLTADGLAARLGHSLTTIEGLAKYHGHLLNWYHTRTLEPLEPRYVSTVDSGNLVGALLVTAEGLQDAARAPVIEGRLGAGFNDTVGVLRENLRADGADSRDPAVAACDALLDALPSTAAPSAWRDALVEARAGLLPELVEQVAQWVERGSVHLSRDEVSTVRADLGRISHLLEGMLADCDRLLPWLGILSSTPPPDGPTADWAATLTSPPGLDDLPAWCEQKHQSLAALRPTGAADEAWFDAMSQAFAAAGTAARAALHELHGQAMRCRQLVEATDFRVLYDSRRNLFNIGYNVSAAERDANHYDLLASEARLASYIAIARRQVPVKHWLHLGRPFNRLGTRRVLVSWSATAFEYLMPRLFMASPGHSVMDQSCEAAVARQMRFGAKNHVPWGISESGFYELDDQSHYQYRAFGVPGLGLKREQKFRLVISPYSSLLALPYAAHAVVENLAQFARLGVMGRYGAHEAIDFGAAGHGKDRHRARIGRVVASYMSHHQGMILMAIANALHGERMVQRFHRDPDMQRARYLLFERLPPGVPGKLGYRSAGQPELLATSEVGLAVWEPSEPRQLNALSNGSLHAHIASHGAMSLIWRDQQLTRGALLAEPTAPSRRIYLRDVDRKFVWSPLTGSAQADTRVTFAPHEVQFNREQNGVRSRLDITLAQDQDVEIQRLTLTNHSGVERHIQALQYSEPVLTGGADDRRHPAFSKMFVEVAAGDDESIVFRRRPRGAHERPLYLAQSIIVPDGAAIFGCTDRREFLGNGGDYLTPAWFERAPPGKVSVTPSLDPVAALGSVMTIAPHQSVEIIWLTAVGRDRPRLFKALQHYRQRQHATWAFWQSRFASERELSNLGLAAERVPFAMTLVSRLVALRGDRSADLTQAKQIQQNLWSCGISGDWPILLLHLRTASDGDLAQDAILAHNYCSARGIVADLVILDHVSTGYSQPTRDRLQTLAEQANRHSRDGRRGRVYLLGAGDLPGAATRAVAAAARVTLDSARGPVEQQLRPSDPPSPLPHFVPMPSAEASVPIVDQPLLRPADLQLDNGLGGFSADGEQYVIYLAQGDLPPQPWINVVANPQFGTLVSASGAMFTWAGNSGENRLTPWSNDAVRDPTGEAIYLRDEETAVLWSPTPRPAPSSQPYQVQHGVGYTRFVHRSQGMDQTLTVHTDMERPLKFMTLKLRNRLARPRRLTATFFSRWVLGADGEHSAPFIVPDCVPELSAMLARNAFRSDRSDATAFVSCSLPLHGMTADRDEFLGPTGDMAAPEALSRIGLSGRLDAGVDPCAALQVHIDLPAHGETELHFVLGEAETRADALEMIEQVRQADAAARSFSTCEDYWRGALGGCRVTTPDRAFDLLLNRCLLYQAQACRLWARAAFYQCGGGLGFRDQLQDVMALMSHQPQLAREQILDAACSQFVEGDVLHWWHINPRRGVRTRCSDDLLWLPFVTTHYIDVTGDREILNTEQPYLRAPPLAQEELERYAEFQFTEFSASLYEHCCRALDLALGRLGSHGLPLIGTCDWNDGFSRVGVEGRGESVWLAWFLIACCRRFAEHCDAHDEAIRANTYRNAADKLAQAVEEYAWDGDWYRRAYYDDGTPLGSAQDRECRIDLNAQSWSVMCGAAPRSRAAQAMASALRELVIPEERLVLLLTPPFDKTTRDPGYIKGYPRGVRENGAQYTHAAVWAAWAVAELGNHDQAKQLFDYLNPLLRCTDRASVVHYRVEPYVMAADIYGAEPFTGRGGWTWYTGAAGWMYRLGVEQILGLRKHGETLEIAPLLPAAWPGFKATWRHGTSNYHITVQVADDTPSDGYALELNGSPLHETCVPLVDDGQTHDVHLTIARRRSSNDAACPPKSEPANANTR